MGKTFANNFAPTIVKSIQILRHQPIYSGTADIQQSGHHNIPGSAE
jgi:hypothetical protein